MSNYPAHWLEDTLSNLADYHNGAAFKSKDWAEDGLPIIRIEQINNPESETDKFSGLLLPNNYIDTGDLIFSWSATLKVVIWSGGPGALNQHLYKVVPKSKVSKNLLLHLLDFNMDSLSRQSQGSTMKHVTRKELSRYCVYFPACPFEQEKLANILDAIDRAIEKTEVLIEKYQQIKAGLMHDLFTRGVTADGKLRPTREQAPELYQETPIGWIPKDWGIDTLKTIFGNSNIVNGPFGSDLLTSELKQEGVPVLYCQDIRPGVFSKVSWAHVTSTKATQLAFCNVKKGDILLSKVGTPPCDSCVYPEDQHGIVTQDVIRIRPTNNTNPIYFSYLFNSSFGRKSVKRIAIEGTRERVSLGDFKGLSVPYPNIDEQNAIGTKLIAIQDKISTERYELEKLKKCKNGLMHDLLTGKVAVKTEEPEAGHV